MRRDEGGGLAPAVPWLSGHQPGHHLPALLLTTTDREWARKQDFAYLPCEIVPLPGQPNLGQSPQCRFHGMSMLRESSPKVSAENEIRRRPFRFDLSERLSVVPHCMSHPLLESAQIMRTKVSRRPTVWVKNILIIKEK